MNELAPCPFCGGPVHETHGQNPDSKYYLCIMCRKCKIYMKGYDTDELTERWNRRVKE